MVFHAKDGLDVEKTVTDTQFRIATNSKLFCILSDSIYTRKIEAVIRELCCNAFDAHSEAGQSKKFQVTLPSVLNPAFRVRDFGNGLCEDEMRMYTTYGESTKSGSNAYIGAFGIGAKSPFAYTNTFNVISYHGGRARSYSMFVEDGVPRMTKLGESVSEDPSGLEVFFSVGEKDIDEFKRTAITVCALMSDKIEFRQASSDWLSRLDGAVKDYCWIPADYLGRGYATANLKVDTRRTFERDLGYLYIVQGNVRYAMSTDEVIDLLKYSLSPGKYDKAAGGNNFFITGFLRVPNGTFVPHPSRECLSFDEITKSAIKNIFSKIYKYHVEDAVDRALEGVKSYYDLFRRVSDISFVVKHSPRILSFSVDFQNVLSGSRRISNYAEWRDFGFPCKQIISENGKASCFKDISNFFIRHNKFDRIYYTSKYPFSRGYRYRIIKDISQSKAKNPILLIGDTGKIFTEDDKATFVNVQSLPSFTRQDLAEFKKANGSVNGGCQRVGRNSVSFLLVERIGGLKGWLNVEINQRDTDRILQMRTKFPVYWTGSNRRYEICLGRTVFNIKTHSARKCLSKKYFEFFLDYIASRSTFAAADKKGLSQFAVAVLPDNHSLRGILPRLEDSLVEGVRFVYKEFMSKKFYEVRSRYNLSFFNLLAKHPKLLARLADAANNTGIRDFIRCWISDGMPELEQNVKKPDLPFQLLPADEGKSLNEDYCSNRNIMRLYLWEFYKAVECHGFPLAKILHVYDDVVDTTAEDLLDYLTRKSDYLFKDGN
jgi:hypothetical protein